MKVQRIANLARGLTGLLVLLLLAAGAWVALATLATSARANMNFANGQKTWGPFEDYWKANGGLARFGLPVTGIYETSDGYAAQFFERAVLIYDRNAISGSNVQQQPVGWMAGAALCTQPAFSRTSSSGRGQYFAQTGHNLSGAFLDYWRANNGAARFGYPISEPFNQTLDGTSYLVQYFENARFELHGNSVGLGLLGNDVLALQGGASTYANLPLPTFYPAQGAPLPTAGQHHSLGHAADYSWIAGRVKMDNFPGESRGPSRPSYPPRVLIASGLAPNVVADPMPTPLPNGVIVGHATHSDVSPPLRDIQPRPPIPACSAQAGYTFVPMGRGWDPSRVKDGDYVVLHGHLASPSEVPNPGELGRAYVVDRMEIVR